MGQSASHTEDFRRKESYATDIDDEDDIATVKKNYARKYSKGVPLDVQVAHYTPSMFPLVPVINPEINAICAESWKKIVNKKEIVKDDQGMNTGAVMAGITMFYNDFYTRLEEVDQQKKVGNVHYCSFIIETDSTILTHTCFCSFSSMC